MRQLGFVYRPAYTGKEAWRGHESEDKPGGLLELLRLAADHLGRKEVTFECDVGKSTLSEAISESNDKRWAGEWICKVLAMLAKRGDDESLRLGGEILSTLVGLMPCFALVDVDKVWTDEDEECFERLAAKRKAAKQTGSRKRAA